MFRWLTFHWLKNMRYFPWLVLKGIDFTTGSIAFAPLGLNSLPEFMNFKLFGKTILVVNIKFELFLGHPLSK